MSALKLSILLPVRNEEENLAVMLRILRSAIEVPHEVVVITDTPDDLSIPVVKRVAERYPEVRHVGMIRPPLDPAQIAADLRVLTGG